MKHSSTFAGGSTAARTIACPGWRKVAKTLSLVSKSSDAANEGSMLHDCAEMIILDQKTADELIGYEAFGIPLDNDLMVDKLLPAIDAFDRYLADHLSGNESYLTEQRVNLPDIEGAFGTADVVVWDPEQHILTILDWKFGYMSVDAHENDQLAYYANGVIASGALESWVGIIDTIHLVIVQGSGYSLFETDLQWVDSRLTAFTNAISLGDHGDPHFTTGPHCKFCPVLDANQCPEHKQLAAGALDTNLAVTVGDDLAYWLDKCDSLEEFTKAVRAAGHSALEAGQPIDGFKLVAKRAMRKWVDVDATEKKLRQIARRKAVPLKISDLFDTKLKTPAGAEKLLKTAGVDKSELTDLIESVSSGTTVARAADKRAEILGLRALGNLSKITNL